MEKIPKEYFLERMAELETLKGRILLAIAMHPSTLHKIITLNTINKRIKELEERMIKEC